MTKMPTILFAGLVASVIIASPLMAADKTRPVTGEALAHDQTFTYRLLNEFSSVDPQLIVDVSGGAVARDLFEGLFNQDADGNLVPGVALSFVMNDAKDVYIFKLRDNARWSNGDPVVAGDFVYAWRRLVDPELGSPSARFALLMSIKNAGAVLAGDMATSALGVKALDDYTFEVTLSDPLPILALMTTLSSTFPAHQATIEAFGDEWTKPGNIVSNGAYILTEHVPGERSVRMRNVNYWNNDATIIDKTVALIVNDENVALTRYFAGEFDRTQVPVGQFPKLNAEFPDQAVSFPRLCSYFYTFNLSNSGPEAFKDVRVRKALSLAIDRSIIVDNVLAGGQTEAFTLTPAATAGFKVPDVPAALMSQSERDALAVSLLAEAGYDASNILTFDMLYNTSEGNKKIAIAVSQMWKQKLGAKVTLANQEWKTYLSSRREQNFQLARGVWCGGYNEASAFFILLHSRSGVNDGKFTSVRLDELLEQARTAADTQPLYTEIEQIIADEVPIISVYHLADNYMLDTDLGGWPVQNVEQNWYSKDLYKIAE